MAKNNVDDYSTDPAANLDIAGFSIAGTAAVSNFDNALRELMADIAATPLATSPGTMRANLGLGTMATQGFGSVAITGGSITGITDLAVADGGTGASTAAAARANLSVYSKAETDSGFLSPSEAYTKSQSDANFLTSTPILANDTINTFIGTVASSATLDLGAAAGIMLNVSGDASITSLGFVNNGSIRVLRFVSAATLVNSTAIRLPAGRDITAALDDVAVMRSLGGGNWVLQSYSRGLPWSGAMVGRSIDKPVPNGTPTPINWNVEREDIGGWWIAGQPTRLTVPTGVDRVRVKASAAWATSTTGLRQIVLNKNGAEVVGGGVVKQNAIGDDVQQFFSAPVPVFAGDYFEVIASQTSGGNLAILMNNGRTYFSIEAV